jgi:hypothetical protein
MPGLKSGPISEAKTTAVPIRQTLPKAPAHHRRIARTKVRAYLIIRTGNEQLAYFCVENVNTVVECMVSPGFSSVLGKSGWLGESG